MAKDYLAKLKSLSPAAQAELSDEKILAKLDELDAQYGVKATLVLLDLLLGEIDYAKLAEKLKADYGFNDFLAGEIKGKFGALIKDLGASAAVRKIPSPSVKEAKAPVSSMIFSRADEEEVKKYIDAAQTPKTDYSTAAKRILAAFGYQNADELMVKRLENIVIARIRDVRDDLETRENLLKSKKVGGLEFSEAEADHLLNLINNKPDSEIVWPLAAKATPPEKPADFGAQPTIEMEDGLPVVKMPEDQENKKTRKQENKISELLQPLDDVKIKATEALPKPMPQPFVAEKKIPESVLNAKTASRPNLDDVKLEKKLFGPIEELEMMTIIDFRRLAADPQAAVNEVKEKIDLLEKDGFNQKIAGIAAWQKSEVSKFYRLLGQLSMSENKNIEEIIKERLMSGKPTLTLDEFHAVMELNRALRY